MLANLSADDPGELVGVDGLDVVRVEPELELVPALRRHGRPVVLLLQGELQGERIHFEQISFLFGSLDTFGQMNTKF